MKDVKEFEKLFKITIPIEEHVDYYIDTLKKSEDYADLDELVSEYEEYEEYVLNDFKSMNSYKLGYALKKMKKYLLETNAYNTLQNIDFGQESPRTKNILKDCGDTYLVSFDFSSANYNALKTFDKENELKDSWESLCEYLDIHPVLAKSKSFRQLCFGNTNPKRLQKIQRISVSKIVEKLLNYITEEEIVFISHDEFIISLKGDGKSASERVLWLNNIINKICEEESIYIPIKYKVFKEDYFSKLMAVRTFYQVKMGGLSEQYKKLFSVPKSKYFKYFKKYILEEEAEERDLLFMHDNEVAIWKV